MNMRASLVCMVAAALFAHGGGNTFDEYHVKAAFLYNFAKFVEWPPNTFAASTDPVTICVAGRNPFGTMLEELVQGKTAGGRTLAVRTLRKLQHASRCQILFVAASEQKQAWVMLDQVAKTGILTVGESDEFMAVGGMVNLKLDGARVRIQIAPDVVEHAKLLVSSRVLSLAEIVRK